MKRLQRTGLSIIYALAVQIRAIAWDLWRPTLIGVRALVINGDTVLLVRHQSGNRPWALPGGGVERHERMAEAARREVYEEAGVPVRIEGLLGVYDAFRGEVTNYITVFICAPLGEAQSSGSLEIAEARYFPLDALPEGLDTGSGRRIAEYIAGLRGISELW